MFTQKMKKTFYVIVIVSIVVVLTLVFLFFAVKEEIKEKFYKQRNDYSFSDSCVFLSLEHGIVFSFEVRLGFLKPEGVRFFIFKLYPYNVYEFDKKKFKDVRYLKFGGFDLDLSDTNTNDDTLSYISPSITGINLSNTKVTDKGLVFFNFASIIDLLNTKVTDKGLSNLKRVVYLCLTNTKVTGEGLSYLTPETLKELEIGELNEKGFSSLNNFHNLEHLHILDNDINNFINSLKSLKKLRILRLTNVKIDQENLKKLQGQLPECLIVKDGERINNGTGVWRGK